MSRITVLSDLHQLRALRRPRGAGRGPPPAAVSRSAPPPVLRRVDLRIVGADLLRGLAGPALLVANHESLADLDLVRAGIPRSLHPTALPERLALAIGRSPIVFPEAQLSRDGNLGAFRAGPFDAACRAGAPIVPLALRGTLGLDPAQRGTWSRSPAPVVVLRVGDPIGPFTHGDEAADAAHTAVSRLLAEDRRTWWEDLSDHGQADDSPAGWRGAWEELDPARRPSWHERPRIWE